MRTVLISLAMECALDNLFFALAWLLGWRLGARVQVDEGNTAIVLERRR